MFKRTKFRASDLDLDVIVSADSWQENADLIPKNARDRVERLDLFHELYQGDFRQIMPREYYNAPVQENYFEIVPNIILNMLMAYPPEAPVDKALLRNLNEQLAYGIRNYFRYGTAIMIEHDGIIRTWDSRYVFPTPTGVVYLDIYGNEVDVYIADALDESYRLLRFEYSSNRLGEQIDEIDLGNAPFIVSCGHGEPSGIWGESLYYRMIDQTVELNMLFSGMSNSMRMYEFPQLAIFTDDPSKAKNIAQVKEGQDKRIFNRRYGEPIVTTAKEMKYIQPNMVIEQFDAAIDIHLTNLLYNTGLSKSFLGMYADTSASRASGETIVQTQQQTKLLFRQTIACFLPLINDLLTSAHGSEVEAIWIDGLQMQQLETEAERNRNATASENNNVTTV